MQQPLPVPPDTVAEGDCEGQVIYKAEKNACCAVQGWGGDGLQLGSWQHFQVSEPFVLLAAYAQHSRPKAAT